MLRKGWKFWIMLRIGKLPGHALRRALYKALFNFKFPKSTVVYKGVEIRDLCALSLGEHTIIGHDAILDARHGLEIGNNVNLSTGVWIWTTQHDPQDPDFREVGGKVVIEDYAWISCRTVILPGVRIGRGCVVAAGAVVTHDTPPWTIVGGVPAKVIGQRNPNLRYTLGGYIPII